MKKTDGQRTNAQDAQTKDEQKLMGGRAEQGPCQGSEQYGYHDLLSVADVASQFGIPRWTIYSMLRRVPHIRFNRRVYFRREEFEKWLDRFKVEPNETNG